MSSVYSINTLCLRYIVPFTYTYDNIEEAIETVEAQKREGKQRSGQPRPSLPVWERRLSSSGGAGSDLYGYIQNEFRFHSNEEALSEKKAGCEWIYWRSDEAKGKDGKKIAELRYFPGGLLSRASTLPDGINVSITNLGLILFRNRLGFVWYELSVNQESFDSESLKTFQNQVKELNKDVYLWEKRSRIPEYGVVSRIKTLKDGSERKEYLAPFLIGLWLDNILGFLSIHYLSERPARYKGGIKKALSMLCSLENEKIGLEKEPSCMPDTAPDKAILFTYGAFTVKSGDDSGEDRKTFTYYLTSGYRDSFHFSLDISDTICHPFDDVLWYASQEGASYLAWPHDDNRVAFNTQILAKFKKDYFILYIKVLYQSLSLLIFAEMIQKEISAVSGKYLDNPLEQNITELYWEINLFLTKSMATSVSHVHHQSEFYIYLKKQIRVHEDVKSVTAGLNALDLLQRKQKQHEETQEMRKQWTDERARDEEAKKEREKREAREKIRDNKLQAIMGLFAILGIFSALVDCFDFVSRFDARGEWSDLTAPTRFGEIIGLAVVIIIGIIAVYFAIRAIISAFRDKEE